MTLAVGMGSSCEPQAPPSSLHLQESLAISYTYPSHPIHVFLHHVLIANYARGKHEWRDVLEP